MGVGPLNNASDSSTELVPLVLRQGRGQLVVMARTHGCLEQEAELSLCVRQSINHQTATTHPITMALGGK